MQSPLRRLLLLLASSALLLGAWVRGNVAAGNGAAPKTSILDQDPIPRTPERLARGKYLVNGILQCFSCHSQRNFSRRPPIPVPGTLGGGRVFSNTLLRLPEPNRIVAPNISPDPEYGAGKWKDSDFVRALRQGIGHDGRTLFPVMPYRYFRNLSDEDLAAAIVYIRSIAPVHVKQPKTQLTEALKATIAPLPPAPHVPPPDRSDPVKYGEYLVNAGHCNVCHTPIDERGQPLPGMYLAGGRPFTGAWGPDPSKEITVNSLNITRDASGISFMDEKLFIQAMRTGQVRAYQLANVMPWVFLRNLRDNDLKAIYAYLRSVPPVQHRVDNTEPPALCKLCRQKHGFGDRNVMAATTSPAQPAGLKEPNRH